VRQAILDALQVTGPVRADSIEELKRKLGLEKCSNSKFTQALGSLKYKYHQISYLRLTDYAGISGRTDRLLIVTPM